MRLAIACAMLAGCTTWQSTYHRQRVEASELVWQYDAKLEVTRDGKLVAQQRDWDGLAEAVVCVPRAKEYAESAASRDRTGSLMTWGGLAVLAGGVIAGSVLILSDTSNTDQMLAGAGVMLGGVVIGGPTALGGIVTRYRADASAIDAVNVYNDERRGSCR